MTDAPERIWAIEYWDANWQDGSWDLVHDGNGDVEYIRADLHDARIAELEAEGAEARRRRDEWRKKAEGYDEVRLALREKVGEPWPPHMSRVLWAGIAADWRKRAEDAEAEVARKDEALRRLEYWLDTDAEILDAMPDDERASHLRMLGIARAALAPDRGK